jgi:hypothetical protein
MLNRFLPKLGAIGSRTLAASKFSGKTCEKKFGLRRLIQSAVGKSNAVAVVGE